MPTDIPKPSTAALVSRGRAALVVLGLSVVLSVAIWKGWLGGESSMRVPSWATPVEGTTAGEDGAPFSDPDVIGEVLRLVIVP